MPKILDSPAGELPWLWSFDNDYIRLAAVTVVAIGVVMAIAIRPLVAAWLEDRKNQRKYELENKRIQEKIDARREAIERSRKP